MGAEQWSVGILKINHSFIDKDVYTTGPIIFTKEITDLGEVILLHILR